MVYLFVQASLAIGSPRRVFLTYFVHVILIIAGGVLTRESESAVGMRDRYFAIANRAVASVSHRVDLLECADLVSALALATGRRKPKR